MWAPDGPTWWPPAIGNPNIISPISRGYLSATYNPGYLWVVKNSIPLNKRHHFYLGPCNALKARLGVRFWKFTAAKSYTLKVKTSGPKKSQTWCLVQPWSMGVTHFKYIIICIYIYLNIVGLDVSRIVSKGETRSYDETDAHWTWKQNIAPIMLSLRCNVSMSTILPTLKLPHPALQKQQSAINYQPLHDERRLNTMKNLLWRDHRKTKKTINP